MGAVGVKALPAGTARSVVNEAKGVRAGYEEVRVPPIAKAGKQEQRRVPISELPPHAQLAFRGVASLNPLQSAVLPTALHSNENMLVCAPTGAGKTNVALLSIMQQLGPALDGGVLDRKRCAKVVYIAPMKALAAELVGKFSKALGVIGLKVRRERGGRRHRRRRVRRRRRRRRRPLSSSSSSSSSFTRPPPHDGRCASTRATCSSPSARSSRRSSS